MSWASDKIGQCSYIYRGADLTINNTPIMVLAYDKKPHKNGVCNVLFLDSHAASLTAPQFKEAIDRDNAERRKLKLPEKPIKYSID